MPKPAQQIDAALAYSVREVAELMRKPPGYVYKLIHTNRLRHLDLGSIRVPHEFLLEFYRKAEGLDLSDPENPKEGSS